MSASGSATTGAGKDATLFRIHEVEPPQLEPLEPDTGATTDVERFFVRCNLPLPAVDDPGSWRVGVAGVARPAVLTVAELRRRFEHVIVRAVLQCAGNGRRHLDTPVDGSQWATGAAGCADFGGVRVADVAEACGGVVDAARFLTATGGERAPVPGARVERSVPLAKGLGDGLLALEMNGEPLTVAHGAPVRLLVPGYFAVNSVKHVAVVSFTASESDADIMRSRYRIAPPGRAQAPHQPTCWAMPVKSWITAPAPGWVKAGEVVVSGVAFGGEVPVALVEVSVDAGRTWVVADLDPPDSGPFAWQGFRHGFAARAGTLVVVSRATDVEGRRQPERSAPNEGGYALNGWAEPAVALEVR